MSVSWRLSVVTSTRNPRPDYLRRMIDGLRRQTLDPVNWEYVLVDNASDTPVAEVADLSWHPSARVESEPRVGLTWGRLRGIAKTSGAILVFVDDDNVLHPDYLRTALVIAERFSFLGAWGGTTDGEFESPPPKWMRARLRMLAVREVKADAWSNLPFIAESMPTGAGMVVRREVASRYRELHETGARPILLDRVGDSLGSAGDEDLAGCACTLGLGVGVFKDLRLLHLIPDSRLDETYLTQLAEGIAWSDEIRRAYHGAGRALPRRGWQSRIANGLRLATMHPRERRLRAAESRGRERARKDLAEMRPAELSVG